MLLTTLALAIAAVGQGLPDWYEPFPAHKVVGNVFYVGSKDLATFLVTTPEDISSSIAALSAPFP